MHSIYFCLKSQNYTVVDRYYIMENKIFSRLNNLSYIFLFKNIIKDIYAQKEITIESLKTETNFFKTMKTLSFFKQ